MSRYVGITGFMSRAEVDACRAELSPDLTLMCGVLMSAKTLRGIKNRWHRRYPAPCDVASIFTDDTRCLNLIHYASGDGGTPSWDDLEALLTHGGPNLDGFQFNGVMPHSRDLATLQVAARRALGHNLRIVRQETHWSDATWLAERTWPEVTDVLLDASCGKGRSIDAEQLQYACTAIVALRERFPDIGIGIAGGLCAETLPTLTSFIRAHRLSIDAEGRLRDGDEGGTLDLAKARAYLAAAGEIFQ